MGSGVRAWQALVFENAELLLAIKGYLYSTCRPRRCLKCADAAAAVQKDFCRFLLSCSFLCNCRLNADDVAEWFDAGFIFVAPVRWAAVDHLRFLRVVNAHYREELIRQLLERARASFWAEAAARFASPTAAEHDPDSTSVDIADDHIPLCEQHRGRA